MVLSPPYRCRRKGETGQFKPGTRSQHLHRPKSFRLPTKALLAEVGWTSIEWKIKTAKVRLWERAKTVAAGRDTNHIARMRMEQVAEGETKGIVAEVRDIMSEMGREAEWSRMEGLEEATEARKAEIRRWGKEADVRAWERWKTTQKDIYRLTKKTHGEERYLRWGCRKGVVLKFRTGNANLRANRYSGSEARCILCASREPENQEHVLFRCRLYEAQRAELHHDLELVWGADKTNKWKALGELQRAAYVLTNDQHDRRSERAVDAAIKKMLIQVEEVRLRNGASGLSGYDSDGEFDRVSGSSSSEHGRTNDPHGGVSSSGTNEDPDLQNTSGSEE